MKVWPIDPLVPRNLRLEVPEKLPQGFDFVNRQARFLLKSSDAGVTELFNEKGAVSPVSLAIYILDQVT